jgi:alanine racemase
LEINVATAKINLEALRHNLSRVKQLSINSKIMCVIKANAYGHGLLAVAHALSESDAYAVAHLSEARYLREQGIIKKIMVLEGVVADEEYHYCLALNIIPVIHNFQQFQQLQYFFKQNRAFSYGLKIDTGMHRLGFSEEELNQLMVQYQHLESQFLPTLCLSHFACADESTNARNSSQLSNFKRSYQSLETLDYWECVDKSMANSAAILAFPESHFDWLRPGIMLYGVSPFETMTPPKTGLDEGLKVVMTLSAPVIAIKKLQQGDGIGYGASWCCPEEMSIAIIAIGYGDGYPRHAPSGTPVLIHGIEVPLVGRVSMDMITVDLRPLQAHQLSCQIGDKVTLWGEGLPIERISQKAGTIAYELLCQITQRVCFEYE